METLITQSDLESRESFYLFAITMLHRFDLNIHPMLQSHSTDIQTIHQTVVPNIRGDCVDHEKLLQ